jgi:hypothetical protein
VAGVKEHWSLNNLFSPWANDLNKGQKRGGVAGGVPVLAHLECTNDSLLLPFLAIEKNKEA